MTNVESDPTSFLMLFVLIWVIVGGGIGAAIGSPKGRGGVGFFLGLFLGFIGWIIVAVIEPSGEQRLIRATELAHVMQTSQTNQPPSKSSVDRACPWCAEPIKAAAVICRFCDRDVPPLANLDSLNAVSTDLAELSDWLSNTYPRWAKEAIDIFSSLPNPPVYPKEWLGELCLRLGNGSDGKAAASRISLAFPES
jgi:hypothetical protein